MCDERTKNWTSALTDLREVRVRAWRHRLQQDVPSRHADKSSKVTSPLWAGSSKSPQSICVARQLKCHARMGLARVPKQFQLLFNLYWSEVTAAYPPPPYPNDPTHVYCSGRQPSYSCSGRSVDLALLSSSSAVVLYSLGMSPTGPVVGVGAAVVVEVVVVSEAPDQIKGSWAW